MSKGTFLGIIVIAALTIAGFSGSLADFSDSEEELGDTLQAGSLDLKVNNADDPDVLPFHIGPMTPDKWYNVTKTVRNAGTVDGWLYVHIKNVTCNETNDKDINGDGVINALDKPEPERVAESGGIVGQTMVPGLGVACDMQKHIAVNILCDNTTLDLSQYDKNYDNVTTLDELECKQIALDTLVKCGVEKKINFKFKLRDVLDPDYATRTPSISDKFKYWPTNRYMGDTVSFDVLFELLQAGDMPDDPPPGQSNTPVIECKWETPDDGDSLHTTPATQVFPPVRYNANKEVQFWAVVSDPEGADTVDHVYASVYYPVGVPGNGMLKYQLELARTDNATGIAALKEAYQQGLVTFGTGFDFTLVMFKLERGEASVFRGSAVLSYDDPAGDYKVELKAVDTDQDASAPLTNFLTYVPVVACEFDFTTVDYGLVEVGNDKWVKGDIHFNTSEAPTVRNIGNTNLRVTMNQDDTGLGMIDGQYNVKYAARLGTAGLQLDFAPKEAVTLPGILSLSRAESLDLLIHVKNAVMGFYRGRITLNCLHTPF